MIGDEIKKKICKVVLVFWENEKKRGGNMGRV